MIKLESLTEGVFDVQKIEAIGINKEELLKIIAYAENYSNHPISQSVKRAYNKKIDEKQIKKYEEFAGRGIIATIGEYEVVVGNEELMKERKIKFEKTNLIGTILYVAIENKYVGYILISDKTKNDAQDTIKKLKKNNIKQIVMLTGDKKM